jgi:hypothetical protein
MPFGFGFSKRVPISEAKRKVWRQKAQVLLDKAAKLAAAGYDREAEAVLDEAAQYERDANA